MSTQGHSWTPCAHKIMQLDPLPLSLPTPDTPGHEIGHTQLNILTIVWSFVTNYSSGRQVFVPKVTPTNAGYTNTVATMIN